MNALSCQRILAVLVLTSVCGLARAASVTPWPELPAVDKARVEWVAKDVWINGVPTRVQQFESSHRPDEVLAFYRALWRGAAAGPPRENQHADWKTISTLHGPFQMVVQVKPNERGGSTGLLSSVNFKEVKPKFMPPEWPEHLPVKVLQVMESIDGPKRGYHVTATSSRGWSSTREALRGVWSQSGWRLQAEVESDSAYLATYERSGKTLEVSVSPPGPGGQVSVLINLTEFRKS